MPELPEVETVRRGLEPFVTGARIESVVLNRPDLRFAFPQGFAERLAGKTITHLGRRAKYLVFTLSDNSQWLSHLGMTGSFAIADAPLAEPSRYRVAEPNGKHLHVDIALTHPEHGALTLAYNDPRRFGFMDLFAPGAPNPYLDGLGPEPLGNALSADSLADTFKAKKTPIKAALLDQRVVAGLGNIYVTEALYRAHIKPTRLARDVTLPELMALVPAIRAVLEEAIAAGGSTLKDFRNAEGLSGYFQHRFAVYDREGQACPTPDCPGTITRIVQSGRSSFFCPVCQT